MRQFRLKNQMGETFDLMRKDAFFHSPSGLGYKLDIDVETAGYFFLQMYEEMQQKTISGEMVFKGYSVYQEFVSFCAKAPLVLCYCPLNTWYYVDCKLAQIDKTEISQTTKRLLCNVDFECFSTWYESLEVHATSIDPNVGKIYNYTYDYTYADTRAGSIEVSNNGSLPSPCKLHIKGPCVNPSWALVQSGKILARGGVTASIAQGSKLVVDSDPSSLEIAEYTNNNRFVQNLYQKSDFSTARFLEIPVGSSKITFSHQGAGLLDAYVEVQRLASSV